MAPAIAHFLVGAGLLLFVAAPFVMRYDVDAAHAIWLIPLGGIWALLPDVYHILPVLRGPLFVLHETPRVDLFAFHFELDRPAIRARYHAAVFGSILLFVGAVGAFWTAARTDRLSGPTTMLAATGFGGGLATLALVLLVGIQGAFPAIAGLVGASGVLVGGALVLLAGGAAAGWCGFAVEVLVPREYVREPAWAAVGSVLVCLSGGLVGVVYLAPAALTPADERVILALAVYGLVFGVVYGTVRGAGRVSDQDAQSAAAAS